VRAAYVDGLGEAASIRFGELPDPVAGRGQAVVRVDAVGPAVTDVQAGQRVWTNTAGYGGRAGATAELVVVDTDRLYPLPPGADPVSFVASVHPGPPPTVR